MSAACGDGSSPPGDPDAGSGTVDAAPGVDAAVAMPGIVFHDYHIAVDVTPDGRTAAFERITDSDARLVLIDTLSGVADEVTSVGEPSRALATGISGDRKVSALHGSEPVHAGVYDETTGWHDLGSPHAAGCDQDIGGGFDISADGHVVVGLVWDGCAADAFRWSDASGTGGFTQLEVLGTAPEGLKRAPTNRATVISDDGMVAAGFAENHNLDRTPALWHADGTGELLDPATTDTPGEVLSISATGRTVAGISGRDGFVWTRGTGLVRLTRFEIALPSDPVYPNAMTADGRVVFGAVGDAFFGIPIAFVWTAKDGMVPLVDVVTGAGITLPEGTILNNVLGASADGTVLVGTAMDAKFNLKTFVLRLPPMP
ncbi:MAG TPA: hypothetical protein VM261_25840 [Kofleriaceae bacterium]|nr:hypothetical protein [Kofleriaceae bacterium]